MKLKYLLLYTFLFIAIGLMLHGCDALKSDSGEEETLITGEVVEISSGNAIANAVVEIQSPADLKQTVTTDSVGNFTFAVKTDSSFQVTINASKQGYQEKTSSFKVAPGIDVTNLSIELSSENGDGSNEEETVGGEAGGPASLQLIKISSSAVSIRGTGGDEESTFTFAVKDSAGRAVEKGIKVNFEIIRGPGGGEHINPSTGFTGSEGLVKSSLASGDSSGVVRIKASIERPALGIAISSTPVLIAIGNGFTVEEEFRIAPVNKNFEAYGIISSSESSVKPNIIIASLGDYRNNPVLKGTAVDFTTTAGNIDASALTDEKGIAIVELRPNGSTPMNHPRGIGFATVTARTIDENNNYIYSSTDVLLTTRNPKISLSPVPFSIPSNGSESFTLTITDQNGYPVAAGSKIVISLSEGLSSTLPSDFTLDDFVTPDNPDPLLNETGRTRFIFTVSDIENEDSNTVNTSITVTVTFPSGASKSVSFPGSRAKIRK